MGRRVCTSAAPPPTLLCPPRHATRTRKGQDEAANPITAHPAIDTAPLEVVVVEETPHDGLFPLFLEVRHTLLLFGKSGTIVDFEDD